MRTTTILVSLVLASTVNCETVKSSEPTTEVEDAKLDVLNEEIQNYESVILDN